MENQASSKSIILNNGLYYGLVSVVASLAIYALGMHLDPTGGYINFAVMALVIIGFPIIGMSQFKKQNNNLMTWGQGVKIGVGIVAIGTVIGIIYQYVFTSFIEPEFFNQVEEVTRQALLDTGASEDQIEMQLEMQSKFQGTAVGYATGFVFMVFIGFVVSAIAAAVKKETSENEY